MLDTLKKYDIVLASGSPRRKHLLKEMGLEFRVETRKVKERFSDDLTPAEGALFLSELKSRAFQNEDMKDNTLLITADTIVSVKGEILGKPHNKEQASEILRKLSGTNHEVITGMTLRIKDRFHSFYATTEVYFKHLSEEEIDYYIENYKPFDKAGAYGIQEWIGHVAIYRIDGSYFNVMGLPTHRLFDELDIFLK
ncbi:MAG: septum formation protein Maf [Bacteroidales bacterium]|nr:septum formation protein Maf [Bacteroidales bacterium]